TGEDFSSGLVALYTLAMAASCHNPTDVSYKGERIDLVEILQQKLTKEIEHIGKTTFPLSNYYQVSLDVLTLCMMDAEISQDIVQILIDAVMNDKFTYGSEFSVDTGAVAALALRCMIDRKTTIHISNALNHILEQILSRITDDGLIGNLYSTGLAIQALSVNSDRVAPGRWNRTKSVGRLLSGILEGSFANPQAASQIVPSLEGRSYLDVTRLNCAEDCSE
ncbi:hypothetical protein chiPu_0022217, partial [Chiloscyllium punctatum]|nr:hypothetical protein [Chiloscyllium punctatum]